MKTFILVLLCLTLSFALKSKKLHKKALTASCTNPSYIISALDGTFLDAGWMPTCDPTSTKSTIIASRLFGSWCIANGNLVFNGQKTQNNCGVTLYADTNGLFQGIFPNGHINMNWLTWTINPLGDGYSVILSNGPSGVPTYALTWNGAKFSLTTYSATNLGQRWLVANAKN